MSKLAEAELRERVRNSPGDPCFADLMAFLITQEALGEAILVGLRGLSLNPNIHRGRLFLAHAMFRSGCIPFAAREVKELCREFPDREHLKALLEKLQPSEPARSPESELNKEEELADVEFDPDLLDEM